LNGVEGSFRNMKLKNKIALVTGSARDIGKALRFCSPKKELKW